MHLNLYTFECILLLTQKNILMTHHALHRYLSNQNFKMKMALIPQTRKQIAWFPLQICTTFYDIL